MPESRVEVIEDQIRTTVQLKSVRVAEFFKDFDRLRSGYVTSKAKTTSSPSSSKCNLHTFVLLHTNILLVCCSRFRTGVKYCCYFS